MQTFQIHINGQARSVHCGQTVAAALGLQDQGQTRCSPKGQIRAPLCGMGVCQECRVSINGVPHQLACQTLCQPGMQIDNANSAKAATWPLAQADFAVQRYTCEIAVIGAGPAGQAAALAAAQAGKSVCLIDDNPLAGGQIWRAAVQQDGQTAAHQSWQAVLAQDKIQWLPSSKVVKVTGRQLLLQRGQTTSPVSAQVQFEKLILATGARERLLPFPGWTLRGVTGLGGLQALVKGGYPVAGKRVVLAGTGPLLFAVAATLREKGAQVVCIAEQAQRASVLQFGATLWRTPNKLTQAASLMWQLKGIPYHCDSYLLAASADTHGDGQQLRSVRIQQGDQQIDLACDFLACAYGLLPNTRLAQALDCRVQDDCVVVDDSLQTNVPLVWCAGEGTGVGGVDKARLEGEIAGLAAAGKSVTHLYAEHRRWRDFAANLQQAFALRPELLTLVADDTIVCRCEDVAWGQIKNISDWASAKLLTRCGMGACQGQVCGSALSALRGWKVTGLRQPLSPCSIASLIGEAQDQ